MNTRALRTSAWLLLALVMAALACGIRVNWMAYALSITVPVVLLMLLDFEERHGDARTIALSGVLVALGVTSRQLLHGIEFSPVFMFVILTGHAFGFTVGFTVGALTMFTSNFFIGHGPWTPFQMAAMGLTGGFASFMPKSRRIELPALLAYSVASAFAYGIITDIFSWMVFVPAHTTGSFLSVILAGMPANAMRALGNLFFIGIMGPVLIRVFDRFARRLSYIRL